MTADRLIASITCTVLMQPDDGSSPTSELTSNLSNVKRIGFLDFTRKRWAVQRVTCKEARRNQQTLGAEQSCARKAAKNRAAQSAA
jgi:hypothetical protein